MATTVGFFEYKQIFYRIGDLNFYSLNDNKLRISNLTEKVKFLDIGTRRYKINPNNYIIIELEKIVQYYHIFVSD
jgi:hypothetical protein